MDGDGLAEWRRLVRPRLEAWAVWMYRQGRVITDDDVRAFFAALPGELRPNNDILNLLRREVQRLESSHRESRNGYQA